MLTEAEPECARRRPPYTACALGGSGRLQVQLPVMATRTLTYTTWLKLVVQHARTNEFLNVSGYPAADVAERLDVSRERVNQLTREGILDLLHITTRAGRVSMSLITEASIERYLAKRVPDRNRQGYFAFQQ